MDPRRKAAPALKGKIIEIMKEQTNLWPSEIQRRLLVRHGIPASLPKIKSVLDKMVRWNEAKMLNVGRAKLFSLRGAKS